MFNIAPWGGLHENVLYSCLGLKRRGWDITVACKSGPLVQRLVDEGIDVHVVGDWTDWANDAKVLARRRWDVVHSHPFASRLLALWVAGTTGAPLISTFHGMYLDGVSTWADRVTTFMAVSPAHAQMLIDTEAIDPSRMVVVPNGVRDELLTKPMKSLNDKTTGGLARVVVASRIDNDKSIPLFKCIDAICDALSHIVNGPDWTIQLAGSGSALAQTTDFLRQQANKAANIRFEALGWVDSERVPDLMRGAVLSVASGRGAAQSLAVGTPAVSFGSKGVYGLQHGQNLALGLWANFGEYPLEDGRITPIAPDISVLLSGASNYTRVQTEGRDAVRTRLLQSDADRALSQIYEAALGRGTAIGPDTAGPSGARAPQSDGAAAPRADRPVSADAANPDSE